MSHTFKFSGCRSQARMLLTNLAYDLKYRIAHDRWKGLLELALKWDNERYYHVRQNVNDELERFAREKYGRARNNLIGVTDKRIWLALPYSADGSLFSIQVSWRGNNDFTFFASVEADVWKLHFARLLFKICWDFKNITQPVEIEGRELKVGEWLAALLFDISGDPAGMLATLDEAEDRK